MPVPRVSKLSAARCSPHDARKRLASHDVPSGGLGDGDALVRHAMAVAAACMAVEMACLSALQMCLEGSRRRGPQTRAERGPTAALQPSPLCLACHGVYLLRIRGTAGHPAAPRGLAGPPGAAGREWLAHRRPPRAPKTPCEAHTPLSRCQARGDAARCRLFTPAGPVGSGCS